ncbi:MAG: nucleotide-binding protein [Candidatus Eisenbacteria bacterium]|nr:nucleotide-binding protein [Candidatus Eisenbacteria bacterium]
MASKRKEPDPPGRPDVDSATGIRLLEEQLGKGRELLQSRPLSSDSHGQWELVTRNYLEKAFGRNSPNVSSVTDVGKYGDFPMGAGEGWWESHRAESLQTQLARLDGLLELLRTEQQLQGAGTVSGVLANAPKGHRIFLVHGHDEAAIQSVARFLEKLDQEVILLREQPNCGRTIIEKFEDYSDVGFAVVLLTGDDRGGLATASNDELHLRARQNVILELGFFLGRLGRSRVCALFVEGIEVLSDYSGVLYVKLDMEGGWRLKLAKELKAAGLSVDMNKAL